MEEEFSDFVSKAKPESKRSLINLLHYLGLRNHDLRELQSRLTALGLSSLGRTESSVSSAGPGWPACLCASESATPAMRLLESAK